ncbi:MAG: 4Fe-4S dicluster domain-containing protein [Eubacteriales bacterium]
MSETKKLPKQMPWVTPVNCEGCGDCVNHCKNHGLKMTETNVEGIYVPWLEEPELCSGCGLCTKSCVMGGIMMTEYVEMAFDRFKNKRPMINKD